MTGSQSLQLTNRRGNVLLGRNEVLAIALLDLAEMQLAQRQHT